MPPGTFPSPSHLSIQTTSLLLRPLPPPTGSPTPPTRTRTRPQPPPANTSTRRRLDRARQPVRQRRAAGYSVSPPPQIPGLVVPISLPRGIWCLLTPLVLSHTDFVRNARTQIEATGGGTRSSQRSSRGSMGGAIGELLSISALFVLTLSGVFLCKCVMCVSIWC